MPAVMRFDFAHVNRGLRRMSRIAGPVSSRKALRAGAIPIHNEARERAPFDRGTLRRSIRIGRVLREGTGWGIRVGTNLIYSAMQEFGGQIFITPAMRWKLHSIGIHPSPSTQFVNIKPQPYLRPAFLDKVVESIFAVAGSLREDLLRAIR